jgi:predicted membrane protein
MDQYSMNPEGADDPRGSSPHAPVPPDHRLRVTPQLLLGVFVIAIGLVFTLDNLGLVRAEAYLRFWPVALIAVGLLKLSQVRDGAGGALGGMLFTIAGLWLLLEETAIIRVSVWDMWPLVLVLLGTYMVWQGATGRRGRRRDEDAHATVNAIAILGGVEYSNNSRRFRGGNLTAIMGGCELDLRHAAIDGDAFLDVFAMWGGIDIRVPEEWTVVSHVLPLLGGSVNKTRTVPGAVSHRLVVRGFAIMGGIEIKN